MTPDEAESIRQRYWTWRRNGDGKLKPEEVEALREQLLLIDLDLLVAEVQRLHAIADWCRQRLLGGYSAFGYEYQRTFSIAAESLQDLRKLLGEPP